MMVVGEDLIRRTGCARTVAATSATTRSGALVYRPDLAVNGRQW
jgi:hypothetical protein